MIPIILEIDLDIALLHTLEIEVDDTGALILIDQTTDDFDSRTVVLTFPIGKAEAIAAAFMRAAREARV